mgnify:CR=1 FL=1
MVQIRYTQFSDYQDSLTFIVALVMMIACRKKFRTGVNSMRVCIQTLGTRGDVQPYVALAVRLIKMGHSVVICTGGSFRQLAEDNGVAFHRVTSDLMALLNTEVGRQVMSGGMRHPLRAMRYAKEVVNPAFRKSLDDFWAGAQGADVILYHPKALAAPDMAKALNIPCISVPPVPITYPVSEFPNMAIAPAANWGAALNRLSYAMMGKADLSSLKEINDFRSNTLGLPVRKSGIYAYEIDGRPIPIICPVSPALFEDVKSWNGHVYLPGFFYLDLEHRALDPQIEAFFAIGDRPIVVSFSSMPLHRPQEFLSMLSTALKMTGNRAVLLTGEMDFPVGGEENIMAVKAAPHGLLFPRAKGIVHHGGIGTVAEALRSGAPQLILPFSVDQPFWAHRLHHLGYALRPLRERALSAVELANAFKEMEQPEHIRNAALIRERLVQEDGCGAAVAYIEQLVKS